MKVIHLKKGVYPLIMLEDEDDRIALTNAVIELELADQRCDSNILMNSKHLDRLSELRYKLRPDRG